MRNAKKNYFQGKLEIATDVEGQWRIINKVINKGRTDKTIKQLKVSGAIIENQQEIASKSNDYFIDIGPKSARSIHTDEVEVIPRMITPQATLLYLS